MRLRHNIPMKAIEEARRNAPPEPISERYAEELASARRKAERAWRAAERRMRTIERKASKAPTPELLSLRDQARLQVLARLAELREVEKLMRSSVGGANWSGTGSVRAVKKGRAW